MDPTPLSFSLRLLVFLLFTIQNIGNTMIPVFITYMVFDFFSTIPSESINSTVAFYTGLVEANYKLMSIIGSFIWGFASDRFSRKTSLTLVLLGNIISYTLLGLSCNYWMAFAARCLAGLCAGLIPVVKALMKDVTDSTNYTTLFSYSGMGTGFGALLGPLIGGLLSHPCSKFPKLFDLPFFHLFPYFLPNLF
jgi:MFS family permease